MKKVALGFVVTCLFSSMAMASDIALSTQANWWSQAAADREMQEIVDKVKGASVERFTASQHAALADWVKEHTGDGVSDLLILCGQCPATLYAPGNAQPDGSLLELFLDDGNCIINTGDWIFYVVDGGGTNGTAALPNVMDIPVMDMWDDDTPVTVTAEGREYTPSLTNFSTDRAIHLDVLQGTNWSAELILALAADRNRADPVILYNAETGGRIGIFFQTSGQDEDPRGEVMSEWINNWYLPKAGSANPRARSPKPQDGSMVDQAVVQASWKPGDFALLHDVYFGESPEQVRAATRDDPALYVGRQATTQLAMGMAGSPAPDGLAPGKTYYWRVDEVKDGDPNSPWKGDVWSFTVRPLTAFNPSPADGMQFVNLDQDLSWGKGQGAIFNTVFIGKSSDEVNNAVAGTMMVVDPTYDPGPLEPDTTYYWRIDEFAGVATHKGPVWSFTTVPSVAVADPHLLGWWTLDEGMGTTAVDWSGHGNHGTLRGDPQWVDGFYGNAVEFGPGKYVNCGTGAAAGVTGDFTLAAWVKLSPGNAGVYGGIGGRLILSGSNYFGFGLVRHSANVFRLWVGDGSADLAKSAVSSDAVYTDTEWHHVAGTHQGLANRLYVDGVQQTGTTNITLAPSTDWFHVGRQYSHSNDRYFPGVIDDVRVYDTASDAAAIQQIMDGNPNVAGDPEPDDGAAVDIRNVSDLAWSAGKAAASHDVYFGTDRQAVAQADRNSAQFRGNQTGTSLSLSDLAVFGGGDYYWRVDAVTADGTTVHKGYVWTFTVPDYLIVDDFEGYTDVEDNRIYEMWVDGLTTSNSTSVVGHAEAPFAEQLIVNSGRQSMPFDYNNVKAPYFAEAEYTWSKTQDWTVEGVDTLSLFVRGMKGNGVGTLYVGLQDSSGKLVTVASTHAALLTSTKWVQWKIPLADFGVKATAIKKMVIGVGDRSNPKPGGAGRIYIDDIRVVKP